MGGREGGEGVREGGRQQGEGGRDGREGGNNGREGVREATRGGREGWREGGRREGASKGGSDDMLCRERERQWRVEEGRLMKEGDERGRGGTRHGRHEGKRGGRKIVEERLSEEGMGHGSKGRRETSRDIHKPTIHKPALEALVLQMTNSEHVQIINSVLRCVRMYCLTDG